ncbi:MAG: hypothetical protein JW954_07065 [Dehalococcoidaceae bacterium]|nr:hypothetical protein [Dehalococcoidaceae bacterium]
MFRLDGGKLKRDIKTGAKKGLGSSLWILKLFIPISALAVLLEWLGVVAWLEPVFKPVMALINLPPEAFFPVVAGIFADVYGAVAVMAVLEFTLPQQVLLILFTAVSHSLIIEGIIQWRSGINFFKITAVRLVASVVSVYLVSLVFDGTEQSYQVVGALDRAPFRQVFGDWLIDISLLSIQIMVVVTLILILQEVAISFGLIEKGREKLSPVMRLMGLSPQALVPWLVAIFGGVTIGSAVIIEECRRGDIPDEELQYFHTSIGINHSMVEHSAVLSTIVGGYIFFIIIARLLSAIIFTHGMRVWHKLNVKRQLKPV